MDTGTPGTTTQGRTHPIIIIAAIAVILFSAVGIGAVMGWIPSSGAKTAETVAALTPPAEAAPAVEEKTVSAAPRPKPVAARPAVKPAPAPMPVAAPAPPPPPVVVAKAICQDCGVIESVRTVEKSGEGSGLGAVAGGVAGGVLGHQVGGGRGRDVMTVVGAIGGAVAGHQIEKNVKKTASYEIVVRFEDGTTRVFSQETAPPWRSGDKVRVVNSEIISNG